MGLTSFAENSAVKFGDAVGIFEDNWCERYVSVDVLAYRSTVACELEVWLMPNGTDESAEFVFRLGSGLPFRFLALCGVATRVTPAAELSPGEPAKLVLICSNRVQAPGDVRELSFVLKHLALRGNGSGLSSG